MLKDNLNQATDTEFPHTGTRGLYSSTLATKARGSAFRAAQLPDPQLPLAVPGFLPCRKYRPKHWIWFILLP